MTELDSRPAIEPVGSRGTHADAAGLAFRPMRVPDDYAEMNRIANAARAKIGVSFTTTADQLRTYYESATRFVPSRDVAIVEVDGRMVGYARSGTNDEGSGLRVYEIVAMLDPEVDAARIFPVMLDVIEEHIRGLAAADPAGPKAIETSGGDGAPDLERVILDAGFEPVRHGYEMVRPHLDDLPDASLPEGLEIREVEPAHLRPIWEAGTEAFRDAWGFVEPVEGDYEQWLAEIADQDARLWRIAWDGDQIAGQVRSFINPVENERYGRKRGYTESISVRRPYRRRGLARALIAASFPLLRERGMTEAALGVDTENVSGALRVYERCGFVPVSRTTTYRKQLD